jgi:hypothetical protein
MKYFFTLFTIFILGYQTSKIDISLPAYFKSETYGGGWSLKLNQDSTFLFKEYTDRVSSYCEGYWYQQEDTLILNSNPVPQISVIEEFRESNNNELKIYVLGADKNEYFTERLLYNTPDSIFQLKRKTDHTIENLTQFFVIKKSQLILNNYNFTINLYNHPLNFSLKDTSVNIVKVYIDESRRLVSRDMKIFFRNKKIFIDKNNLYLINTNSYGSKWDFPAVRQDEK